jgi:hypothetical protein
MISSLKKSRYKSILLINSFPCNRVPRGSFAKPKIVLVKRLVAQKNLLSLKNKFLLNLLFSQYSVLIK